MADLIDQCPNQGFIDGCDLRPCLSCLLQQYLGSAPAMVLGSQVIDGVRTVVVPHDHEKDIDGDLASGDFHGAMSCCSHFFENFAPIVHAVQTTDGFEVLTLPRS
jgi:hypothetical protein